LIDLLSSVVSSTGAIYMHDENKFYKSLFQYLAKKVPLEWD